jgi:Protein of unknown function (DUF3570)
MRVQLERIAADASVRTRLGAAACLLLATGATITSPAPAEANDTPSWRLEGSALLYVERNGTDVVEPVGRLTRLFANGQTLSAQFGVDAMTGASPTGAMPSTHVQTTTSASGRTSTTRVNEVPTAAFQDVRGLFDLQWQAPVGSHLKIGAGTHFSRERDYRSQGRNATLSLDVWQHLTTITGGVARNDDDVFPMRGIPVGLDDGTAASVAASLPKRTGTWMLGASQILTRRWMVALNTTHTTERGYLTEPYKVVSVLGSTGTENGELTENRPGSRDRTDLLASSVFHLDEGVLYLSYRQYWDDWGVRSGTFDLKVRHPLRDRRWILPHVRIYAQSAADFYVRSLREDLPLPEYASSDTRLGPLRSVTLGLTYGVPVIRTGGEFSLRGEIIHQWLGAHLFQSVAAQQSPDFTPPTDVGALTASYTVEF